MIKKKKQDYPGASFCGCCGNKIDGNDIWCDRCKKHIRGGWEFWNNTYFAVHGKECPYDVLKGLHK